jgi:hypothetical protein
MILLSGFFQDIFVNADGTRLTDFFLRLFVNSLSVFLLIRYVYYKYNSQSENIFSYFLLGLIVFLVATSLENVRMEVGLAFGLFAIFSIIRFRSPPIELKEMTYLFMIIGLSITNALVDYNVSDWFGLFFSNTIVFAAALIMENYKPKKEVIKKTLTFIPSGLHVLNSKKLLLEEVKQNTSIHVLKVEISRIHAATNEVTVWIYFKPEE